jgi:hypothetical protein
MDRFACLVLLLVLSTTTTIEAQETFEVRPAELVRIPGIADSNSPVLWIDGQLRVFTSNGIPVVSTARDQTFTEVFETVPVQMGTLDRLPVWIESAWLDGDGTVYAWYHYEHLGACPNLSIPKIGALVSYDGGSSFQDLGFVLTAPEPPDCSAKNGYFAGGHGDFSVIVDREQRYFYFLYGNYGGPLEEQGVSIARLAMGDRFAPAGAVWKYFQGQWSEPGLGGRGTPIFPAQVSWTEETTDAFWGPSIHWNTYLNRYVVLMNRSCCWADWPQEGIYLSTNVDLENPAGWTRPERVLDEGFDPGWYPQVIGLEPGSSDTLAGKVVRLFVRGSSHWELEFR